MFDIGAFDKLHPVLQIAVVLGTIIGAAWGIFRGLKLAKSTTTPAEDPAITQLKFMFELADQRLRLDLEQIVQSLKDSTNERIDVLVGEFRDVCQEAARDSSKGRNEIFERLRQLELTVTRLEARPSQRPQR